jgi:hypothetical protein
MLFFNAELDELQFNSETRVWHSNIPAEKIESALVSLNIIE